MSTPPRDVAPPCRDLSTRWHVVAVEQGTTEVDPRFHISREAATTDRSSFTLTIRWGTPVIYWRGFTRLSPVRRRTYFSCWAVVKNVSCTCEMLELYRWTGFSHLYFTRVFKRGGFSFVWLFTGIALLKMGFWKSVFITVCAYAAPDSLMEKALGQIFEGIVNPFRVRVEQVLVAEPGTLILYKLTNLLKFYHRTITWVTVLKLLPSPLLFLLRLPRNVLLLVVYFIKLPVLESTSVY